MKPGELKEAVENLTHESFPLDTWLQWFNEALSDLTPVLKLETYETVNIAGTENANIPGDIHDVIKITLNDKTIYRSAVDDHSNKSNYWFWDGQIYFPETKSGTIKIWYYRRPDLFTLRSDAIDIQPAYYDAVILYAAAKSKNPDRWISDKNSFYQDYIIRKAQIEKERRDETRRPRKIRATLYR